MNWNAIADMILADINAEACNWEDAVWYYRRFHRLSEYVHTPSFVKQAKIGEAWSKVHLNETDFDFEKRCFYAWNIKTKLHRSKSMRMPADIILALGPEHFSKAEYWINQSIEEASGGETMMKLAGNLAFKAKFLKRRGMIAEAR